MNTMMWQGIWHIPEAVWPFLVLIAFVMGVLATRIILTPRYCPRCQLYLTWRLRMKAETQEEKKGREPWEVP